MHKPPITVPSVDNLKGQQRDVALALLSFGYLSKEYALNNLKVRALPEIIRRLRLKGWPIDTQEAQPTRLYTLRRDLAHDCGVIASGLSVALKLHRFDEALVGAESLVRRLREAPEVKRGPNV